MGKSVSEIPDRIKEIQIAGISCSLFLPEGYSAGTKRYPVVYINGEISVEEVLEEIRKAGVGIDFILLSVKPESWNDDFTPWGAPAFRKGEAPPQGRAKEYIYRLSEEIKPYMDANYRTKPEREDTVLLGYSLGGLAAVYSLYLTDRFGWVGSLSGSLWYDGFCEFMEKERPLLPDVKIYLSLGKKEKLSRNPRMGKVAECTEKAKDTLAKQLAGPNETGGHQDGSGNIRLEWNDGGHFHETAKRLARAILWWKGGGSDRPVALPEGKTTKYH